MSVKPLFTYISLGSNSGDSKAILKTACAEIETNGLHIVQASSIYFTEPQDDKEQPWFTNQVIKVDTECDPEAILGVLQQIELRLGRVRTGDRRFGPRTIDLDILLYGELFLHSARLTLPHPRMEDRAFVLVPLLEIEPELILPNGKPGRKALAELEFRLEGVKIYQD